MTHITLKQKLPVKDKIRFLDISTCTAHHYSSNELLPISLLFHNQRFTETNFEYVARIYIPKYFMDFCYELFVFDIAVRPIWLFRQRWRWFQSRPGFSNLQIYLPNHSLFKLSKDAESLLVSKKKLGSFGLSFVWFTS